MTVRPDDPESLKAHAGDYPMLHIVTGENPPLNLKYPPR